MLHDQFDLEKWKDLFPLAKLRSEAKEFVLTRRRQLPAEYPDENAVERHVKLMMPGGNIIVGPKSLAVTEQLRSEAFANGIEEPEGVDTDVFVWAIGEPENRAVTKVGGLPYWPASTSWPKGDRGKSARFVAQLNFADSRDIFPKLPGDVLLVFGDDDAVCFEPNRLIFRWMPLTQERLVDRLPEAVVEDTLTPFFGVLHRTQDWPDSDDLLSDRYGTAWRLAVLEGTKIGGTPVCIQGFPTLTGQFLGSIGSISVPPDNPYPFVNMEAPRGWDQKKDLMIGDMGSLFLALRDDGSVMADSQCY